MLLSFWREFAAPSKGKDLGKQEVIILEVSSNKGPGFRRELSDLFLEFLNYLMVVWDSLVPLLDSYQCSTGLKKSL